MSVHFLLDNKYFFILWGAYEFNSYPYKYNMGWVILCFINCEAVYKKE